MSKNMKDVAVDAGMTSRLPRNGIWGRETTSMAPEAGPIPDWKKPSGYSRPSPRAGIPSTVDLAGLLSMAKSLAGSGVTLPDWVKWAAGAAVLGGAIGLIVSQPPVHVVAAAAPATPFVAAAGGGASGWMCP
jgi:hypothetical protein